MLKSCLFSKFSFPCHGMTGFNVFFSEATSEPFDEGKHVTLDDIGFLVI